MDKALLRALRGERVGPPPIWLMRQAGRYLPEYRATREKAGDFLSLCYNSELAAEVTLQPIRRFGFDAAILFADILLLPHALGAEVWFEAGEGPRLTPIADEADLARLKGKDDIHTRLAPVYDTLRILARALPRETALIGFAGAPWTVATYMIAGRGTPDQAPAHAMKAKNRPLFEKLLARIEAATIEYLSAQIQAGAETVKLFDSWAGSLTGLDFVDYALLPAKRIAAALKARHPGIPVIAFPRGVGEAYRGFAKAAGVECVALDQSVDPEWAAAEVQRDGCVQGNLDPVLLVEGGKRLERAARRILAAFANGPHIFNLGHGITPEANPAYVERLIDIARGG